VIVQLVTRFAAGLRFPVPDLIPFVDEVLLALGTLLVGSLRKRRGAVPPPPAADPSKIK
jgi:hypothetical protein